MNSEISKDHLGNFTQAGNTNHLQESAADNFYLRAFKIFNVANIPQFFKPLNFYL
jgi:hypothetical protein